VLLHKLREGLEAEQARQTPGGKGTGCETDTAYFGGCGKPANHRENRTGKRSASSSYASAAAWFMPMRRPPSTNCTPGTSWPGLTTGKRIPAAAPAPTRPKAYSPESLLCRMRRAEIGVHHHIAGLYLWRYAAEMSWREDVRATDNSRLTSEVAALCNT
jgi:hypothetical protein